MITVSAATGDDIEDLVTLGGRLFEEDADIHDTFIDLTWSAREGREDFVGLLADPSSLVLLAKNGDTAIGHLVGYATPSSPTRKPVNFAVLRSMYVVPDYRSVGTGGLLAARFLDWAREQSCVEAHVSSYVANNRAQDFYERLGFAARSLSRVKAL